MARYTRRGALPPDQSTQLDFDEFTLTTPAPPAPRKKRPDPLEKLRELRERHNLPRK